MPRRSSEAIVLRTRPVGEADLIVSFLTERDGKIDGAAKSARKSRRRFGGGLEPLARGRAIWTESEGRDLVRLESFEVSVSFARRQSDLTWFYLFAYLSEVADTFAREREPDERFYRLLRAATDGSESGISAALVRRWFEIWTLRLQGLLPGFEICSRCGAKHESGALAIATATGETLCGRCAPGQRSELEIVRLTPEDVRWIRKALRSRVEKTPDPGGSPALGTMIRHLLVGFTGKPFRTARFLEDDR